MIRQTNLAKASTFFAGLALALSACSDSTNGTGPAGNTAPLTQAEAQQVGQEMRDEASGFVRGANISGMMTPRFEMPFEAVGVFHGPRGFGPRLGCATLSEDPPTDADGDGVPDDLTITYDSTACTFTNSSGSAVFSKTGTIHILDLSQTLRKAVRIEYGALQTRFAFQDTVYFLHSLDGVTSFVSDTTGFSAVDSTTVHRESSRFPVSELAKRWAVNFTADAGQVFSHHHDLPSGDLSIQGSTTRTHDTATRTFQVETTTPLHVDSSCTADDQIVSGELHVVYSSSNGTTTIVVVWNGCGVDPTVTTTTV
jgi:hypothetical protein